MATVTIQITDAVVGFSFGGVDVYNLDGGSTGNYSFGIDDRISGDDSNRIYQVQVTVSSQDDLSGINDAYAYCYDPAGDFQSRSSRRTGATTTAARQPG